MTIYEYLELRYHEGIRVFGAVLFFVGQIFWLGTALITASLGFESVTGFEARWCLVIMVVLGTAYTVLGELADSSLAVLFPDLKLLDDQFCIYQKKSRSDREKNQLVTRYLCSLDSDEFGDSIRPITR